MSTGGRSKIMAALWILLFSSAACPQTVLQPWDNPCYREKVEPNLELKVKQHLTGELKDQSGAPFVQSRILLRRFRDKEKFTTFKEVFTDDEGRYDFGMVRPGKYRFLPSPSRAFKQPKQVHCIEGKTCKLNLVLEANPTDQAFVNCPIQ